MGKFARDTLNTIITKILQLAFGIGISVIIARVLGPVGNGVYNLAILLPTLLIIFSQLGFGFASVYYIGQKKYSTKEVFGVNVLLSILISVIALAIGLVITFLFGDNLFPGVNREYLLLALAIIPFQIFLTFAVDILLGLQKIKKYNYIQLTQFFIFLVLIAVFLLGLHLSLRSAIMANLLSLVIACLILVFLIYKEAGGLALTLRKDIIKDFFSYGIKTYFGNISTFLHLRVDMWMVNAFLNPQAVGFYSVSVNIAERIWLISQSTGTVLFPRVSSETDEKKLKEFTPMVCRNILFMSVLAALVLFLLGRWLIISFFSSVFLSAVLPFQILLIGAVSVSGSRILTNDLAGRGKPIINTYVAIISLIFNIILNLFLIPALGIIGAAWSSAISYTFMFILKTIIYSRISGNRIRDIVFLKKSDLRYFAHIFTRVLKRYGFNKNTDNI